MGSPQRGHASAWWEHLALRLERHGEAILAVLAEEQDALGRDLAGGAYDAEGVAAMARKVKRFGRALHGATLRRIRGFRRDLDRHLDRCPEWARGSGLISAAHAFDLRVLRLFSKTTSALGRSLDGYAAELDIGEYVAGLQPPVRPPLLDPEGLYGEVQECCQRQRDTASRLIRAFNRVIAEGLVFAADAAADVFAADAAAASAVASSAAAAAYAP